MKLDEDGSGTGLRNGDDDEVVGAFVDSDVPSSLHGAVGFILRS